MSREVTKVWVDERPFQDRSGRSRFVAGRPSRIITFPKVVGVLIMRCWCALLVVCVAGCGAGSGKFPPPKLYPVTGSLQVNGKKLSGVMVQLIPADATSTARPAIGVTDAEGNFKIATNGDRGAAAGNYKVVLGAGAEERTEPMTVEEATKISGAGVKFKGMPKKATPYPTEWGNPKTTPKTFEVPESESELKIDI